MPTVKGNSIPGARQTHSRDDMKKMHQTERPHDDLRGDFEGDKNRGPASNQKSETEMNDHARNRKIERDSDREPIR